MPSSSSSALKDAKRITASLRSARLQMEASVLSMGDASELVQEDSKYYRGSFYEIHHPFPPLHFYEYTIGELISDTLDIHRGGLKDALKRTKRSLGNLEFSELKEKYGITIGIGIFTCVALWIIARRLRIVR